MLSDYSEELQILPTNMIVQIFVVFEIEGFCYFFQKVFRKLILIFFSQNLKFATLKLGPIRVISKIANLASKYDCSYPCSFRDMTFFVTFFKNFEKT